MQLEPRQYQFYIISEIMRAKAEGKNLIVELDAGLGKRVICLLLAEHLPKEERLLIITPSQASVRDTYEFFVKFYKSRGMKADEIGYIAAGVPSRLKREILREKRVVIATPISLTNVLRKEPELIKGFKIIVINEVDKVVRRVAEDAIDADGSESEEFVTADRVTTRLRRRIKVTYPWNELIKYLPKDACIVGMSGTLRDKHVIRKEGEIKFRPELETLLEALFPRDKEVDIITMDSIIRVTDVSRFLIRNITVIRPIPVEDERVKAIVDAITEEMEETAKRLLKRYEEQFEEKFTDSVEKAISLLPDEDFLKRKFLRLALVRRFVVASVPEHYSKFLKTRRIKQIIETRTGRKLKELIPERSAKIEKIAEIAQRWLQSGRKVTVLTSFQRVALRIKARLEECGIKVHLLTGRTFDKGAVIREFKESKEPCVLVMTPVGERDIDLAAIDLIIIHDVISTVKTMYQRIKRGRRSIVLILYYADTFEEDKVKTLLSKMRKKYPWTIRVVEE